MSSATAEICRDLPARARAFDLPETDGYLDAGKSEDHEVESVRRFASFTKGQGVILALASFIQGMDVPAFDGVALDFDREPVANFSIKSLLKPTPEDIARVGGSSFRKMDTFSRCEQWEHFYLNSSRHASSQQAFGVEARLREMATIYQPQTSRPHWVLFDQEHSRPLTEDGVGLIAKSITRGFPLRRVMILNAGVVYVLWEGQWKRFGTCGRELVKSPQT